MAPALWANLPPDLLGDPVDFTRFHAVCTAWRDSLTSSHRPAFHPGLLTLNACQGYFLHSSVNFSPERTTKRRLSHYRISWRDIHILLKKPPGETEKKPITRSLVASANGTAAWLMITTDSGTGLLDLLTGAVTLLPAYDVDKMQQMTKNPRGIVYADGTVFLYSFAYDRESKKLGFTSAIVRPGDVTWTPVNTMLDSIPYFTGSYFGNAAEACQDGTIMLSVNMDHWCILTLENDDGASRKLEPSITWYDEHRYRSESYILEFQGQLLWVSVLVHTGEPDPARAVSLVVHALEQDKTRWVIRGTQSLNGHVLFLGSHASFFMDAGVLDREEGGCAYFLFGDDVMRYNFVNNETKLVERIVHPEWPINESQNMHWLQPRPAIAPIQDIRRRLRI